MFDRKQNRATEVNQSREIFRQPFVVGLSHLLSLAAKIAIVIDNVAVTFAIVVQLGIVQFTTVGLAACMQIIAFSMDIHAGTRV